MSIIVVLLLNTDVPSRRYDPNINHALSQSITQTALLASDPRKHLYWLNTWKKKNVWNSLPLPDPIEEPLAPPQPNSDYPFTMFELYRAFRRTKTGRAPGPDNLPMETLRLLPHPIKRLLLTHYNDCLLTGTAPDHWKLSKVVMIYKGNQKNSRSPSSYRPISLANSIYEVYACMLQQRLGHSMDQFLHPNQYGFRAGRSISTQRFPLSRLTEFFERHSTSLYILFLDWSQAFDSIGHPHLAAALRKSPLLVNAIMALLQNCQFFVTDPAGDPPSFPLARGIRQGYPLLSCQLSHQTFTPFSGKLSPILHGHFLAHILLRMWNTQMTQLWWLAHRKLFSRLLHLLQHLAARIGLLLNGSKCPLLVITVPFQSLPPSMRIPTEPVTAPFVLHSFKSPPCEESLDTIITSITKRQTSKLR